MIAKKLILLCLLATFNSAFASDATHAQLIGKIFPPLPRLPAFREFPGPGFGRFPRRLGDHSAAALTELKQGALVTYPDSRINQRGKDEALSNKSDLDKSASCH